MAVFGYAYSINKLMQKPDALLPVNLHIIIQYIVMMSHEQRLITKEHTATHTN